MRTIKTIAIALITLAVGAGTQTIQAHGQAEKEYIESLFAIAWFESGQLPRSGKHKLYLLNWKPTAFVDKDNKFAELPITGGYLSVFNDNKKFIGRVLYGAFRLIDDEGNRFHQAYDPTFPIIKELNAKRTFYLQLNGESNFTPATAMKLEVFPNRRIAKISIHDGFRRIVPLQQYSAGSGLTQHKKQPPTAINFGPIK